MNLTEALVQKLGADLTQKARMDLNVQAAQLQKKASRIVALVYVMAVANVATLVGVIGIILMR